MRGRIKKEHKSLQGEEGAELQVGSGMREHRSLQGKGRGAASSREQEEEAQVPAGEGKGHSFNQGGGGRTGPSREREGVQLQVWSRRREDRSLPAPLPRVGVTVYTRRGISWALLPRTKSWCLWVHQESSGR